MPVTIQKPPHGQPCNGCGQCCEAVLCPVASKIFGGSAQHEFEGPCPALETEPDGRRTCGIIKTPGKYAALATLRHGPKAVSEAMCYALGAGLGCDAQLDGEPRDEEFYKKITSHGAAAKALKYRRILGV